MPTSKFFRHAIAALSLIVGSAFSTAQASAENALDKIKSAGEIRIGWAEWRPLEYRDTASGDLKGVLIAFAEEIARRLEAKSVFVQDNWSTMPIGIEADKFQIALMGVSEARERVLDFSLPMYHVPYSVIVKDASGHKTFDEVNTPDHSIAVTTGSTTDELLTKLAKSGELKAQVVRLKDVGGALLSLTSGKTTAFATTVDALAQIVEQQKALRIVEGSFGATDYAIAHAKDQGSLNTALNDIVKSMMEDGAVARLLKEHSVAGSIVGAQK
jgi:ABC-type amino acid transport substrate-binding protein